MSDFPQNQDIPTTFIGWLREDLQKLTVQVNRLEQVTSKIHEMPCRPLVDHIASKIHETPCVSFKDHIENHKSEDSRWWNMVRLLLPYIIVAFGAGAAVYYKVML